MHREQPRRFQPREGAKMTMLNHLSALPIARCGSPCRPRWGYAVSLIDRRTGKPHRISDIPLRLMTCEPFEAAHELMRNRDPAIWDTFIERLDTKGIRAMNIAVTPPPARAAGRPSRCPGLPPGAQGASPARISGWPRGHRHRQWSGDGAPAEHRATGACLMPLFGNPF